MNSIPRECLQLNLCHLQNNALVHNNMCALVIHNWTRRGKSVGFCLSLCLLHSLLRLPAFISHGAPPMFHFSKVSQGTWPGMLEKCRSICILQEKWYTDASDWWSMHHLGMCPLLMHDSRHRLLCVICASAYPGKCSELQKFLTSWDKRTFRSSSLNKEYRAYRCVCSDVSAQSFIYIFLLPFADLHDHTVETSSRAGSCMQKT